MTLEQLNNHKECETCYHFDDDPDGVYECQTCFRVFCSKHRDIHQQETNHSEFKHYYCDLDPNTLESILENVPSSMVSGFQNLGNTCYFNSNLHVLFAIEEFVNFCLTGDCDSIIVPNEKDIKRQIGHQFHRFVTALYKGDRLFMRPTLLRQAIDADNVEYLDPRPQDSIDFFNYMMRTIKRKIGFEKSNLNLTEFNFVDTITCENCSQTFQSHNTRKDNENSNDPFYCFIVKPRQHPGECEEPVQLILDEMIDDRCCFNFHNKIADSSEKTANGYKQLNWKCPNCNCCKGKIVRKIDHAPKYLYINNRLDHGSRTEDTRKKLKANLQFDINNLDISRHLVEGSGKYKLIAFMHHMGRWAKWGHDISYMRKQDSENIFYKFNDIDVREVNVKNDVEFGKQYLYLFKKVSDVE